MTKADAEALRDIALATESVGATFDRLVLVDRGERSYWQIDWTWDGNDYNWYEPTLPELARWVQVCVRDAKGAT
jgi:hypothetical protein